MNKRLLQRKISPDDLNHESENRFKYFRIKYKYHNELFTNVREYQKKENVTRILNTPFLESVELFVMELVDSG